MVWIYRGMSVDLIVALFRRRIHRHNPIAYYNAFQVGTVVIRKSLEKAGPQKLKHYPFFDSETQQT